MAEITSLIEQQISQHIANPQVLSSGLVNGKIQGRFKAQNRVYNYVLSRKDLIYYPAGRNDSSLFSALFLERFDAVAKRPKIGKSNCTYKSYECGKICLGLRKRCKKNINDVERVAKIFYLMEQDARTGKNLYDKAIANVAEGDRAKVIARAQKMRNSERRNIKAQQLREERNAKQAKETGNQRVGVIQSNNGGTNSTGYLPRSTERIKVAREALTQSADPRVIPERLRQHLNEFQLHGAALAIQSMDKQGGFLLADGTGIGKSQPLTEPILTPKGWVAMGDLNVGDFVVSVDGTPTKIVNVYPQGSIPVFRVEFNDGSWTECSEDHLWLTQTWSERRNSARGLKGNEGRVRKTSEIAETLLHKGGQLNHMIPMASPVEFTSQAVLIDPYVMGALLGDGSMNRANKVEFTNIDSDVLSFVEAGLTEDVRLLARPAELKCGCNPNYLIQALKEYGLKGTKSNSKFIPDVYKYNSQDVRISVLRGLMDTDGYVAKGGHSQIFTTVSEQLCKDVLFLCQSLGGIGRISTKTPTFTHKGIKKTGQKAYNLTICLPAHLNPFRMDAKASKVVPKTKYTPKRYIKAIVPVGSKECQCIEIDHPLHLYVTRDFVVTHNTRQLLAVAQTYADRGQKVVIVTANEVLGKPTATDWKKGNYTGSFKNDAEAMGVTADLIKGDTPMTAGKVHLSTYSNLGKLKGQVDKNTVVLYDEAHAMKNKDSAVTGHGKAINNVASKVLFATATPVDKVLHIDYLERANVFSGMSRSQAYKYMGMELVDVRTPQGTIQTWQVPKDKSEEVMERMAGMFDQMTENGNMIKREISLKGVTTKFTDVLVPQEAHDAMQAIEEKYASETDRQKIKGLVEKRKALIEERKPLEERMTKAGLWDELSDARRGQMASGVVADYISKSYEIKLIDRQFADAFDDAGRAQILMSQRRQIEPYKIPAAVESAKQALKEGKQVVVFLSRVNESETKDIKGNLLAGSEGTVKLLREQLIKEGIDPKLITELHGETSTKSADAQAAFQSGKAKVILATIESGGTGINLDDTKGDAPRHMIMMTPPFTAVQNLQAVGRIHRLNTKSESSVEYLFSNTSVDSWSRDITAEKMKTLGAAVAGESGKMSTRVVDVKPHPDLDKTEYKPAPRPPKQITVADPVADTRGLAATIQELHPTITANAWISGDGQKHRVYLEENGNKTGFIKLDKGNVSFDDVHPSDREQMQKYFEQYQKEGAPKPKTKPVVIKRRRDFGNKLATQIQSDHPSLNAKYWTSPDGAKHRIYLKDKGRDGGFVAINPEGVDLSNVRYGSEDIKKYADELLKKY